MAHRIAVWIVTGLLGATAADAHHSIVGVYDPGRQVRLEGVITAFRFVNPHPFVELAVADGDKTDDWRLELDNRHELAALGVTADTLRPGDRVIVTGSGARDSSRRAYVRVLERPGDRFLYEQVGSSPRVRMPAR
ncbi:MAG: hypothetical protein GEU82_00900 [Luteitalea sp.]|nr:hypothetical protein [Luteitalea sp.]